MRRAIESRTLAVFRDIGLQTAGSIKCRARVSKYEARGFRVTQGSVSSPTTLAAPFTYFTEAEERQLGVSPGDRNLPVPPLEVFGFSADPGEWQPQRPTPECKMIFTVGSAAAGKSTVLAQVAAAAPELAQWRWVDLDAFIELVDGSRAPSPAQMATANDRVDLVELPGARAARQNVVWDTTGMNRARLLGGSYRGIDVDGVTNWPEYSFVVVVVVCHPAVALARNRSRPRKLSTLTVVQSWIRAYRTAVELADSCSGEDVLFVASQRSDCPAESRKRADMHCPATWAALHADAIAQFERWERTGELYEHLAAADGGALSDADAEQLDDFCQGYRCLWTQLQCRGTSTLPNLVARVQRFAAPPEAPVVAVASPCHAGRLQQQPVQLSVVTYNIWGDPTARDDRSAALIDLLVAEMADVVCLQEVTQAALMLLGEDVRIRQLYLISDDPRKHGSDALSSTAFRSRASTSLGFANVTLIRRGLATEDTPCFQCVALPSEMGRHMLVATLTLKGGQIVVANVHLDSNPASTDLRMEQLGYIEDALDTAGHGAHAEASSLRIACGDFNFAPLGVEERAIPTGWIDTWGRDGMTLNTGERDVGSTTHHGRIDRVFVSLAGARPMSQSKRLGVGVTVDVARGMPISDHYGLRVDLVC